jgi:uncharacterized protein
MALDYTNEFSFVLKPSSIEGAGIGVFATHDIKANTKLMLNKEGGESRILNEADIPETFRHFGIALPDGRRKVPKEFNHLWIVWYLNHSHRPNIELRQSQNSYYSTRNIQEGEELLVDYNSFGEPEETKADYYKE